jgi:hypothetical protein
MLHPQLALDRSLAVVRDATNAAMGSNALSIKCVNVNQLKEHHARANT